MSPLGQTITRSFTGDIQLEGKPVPVSLGFSNGEVHLRLGGDSVGLWPVAAVDFVPTPDGAYRLSADGDSIVFEPHQAIAFSAFLRDNLPADIAGAANPDLDFQPVQPVDLGHDAGVLNGDHHPEEPESLISWEEPDEYYAAGLSGPAEVPNYFQSVLAEPEPEEVEERYEPEPVVTDSWHHDQEPETPSPAFEFPRHPKLSVTAEETATVADSPPFEETPQEQADEPVEEPVEEEIDPVEEEMGYGADHDLPEAQALAIVPDTGEMEAEEPAEEFDEIPVAEVASVEEAVEEATDTEVALKSPTAFKASMAGIRARLGDLVAGPNGEEREAGGGFFKLPEAGDDAENIRQWVVVVAGGLAAVVLLVIVVLGISALFSSEEAPEPVPPSIAAAPAVTSPSPTTTTPSPAPVVAPASSVANSAEAFVSAWNALASTYAFNLAITADGLPISTAAGPAIHLSYDDSLTLDMTPQGTAADRDLLVAMGMAVAWGEPDLDPEGRKDVLHALGVDVSNPDLADVGGELTRGPITYRAQVIDTIIRFEVIPLA